MGLYGVLFSPWYVVIFFGALLLLASAVLSWTLNREWTRWIPIAGNVLLASYFLPAIVVVVRRGGFAQPTKMITRMGVVALVVISLLVALSNKFDSRPIK